MQESFDWTDQLFLPRPSTTVFFRSRFGVNQNEQDFIALELAARLVEPFDRTEKFYKGRSQEKTHLLRLEFFLLLSPLDQASSVLTFRAMCTVAGPCDPVVWVFSTSGFHRFLATKPVSSETNKAERWSMWRP